MNDAATSPVSTSLLDLLDERKRLVAMGLEVTELDRQLLAFRVVDRLLVLEQRGEKRSVAQRGEVVGYSNPRFRFVIYTAFGVFLLVNVIALAQGRWIAAVPAALQMAILVAVTGRHYSQIYLIQGWSLLLAVGGGARIISIIAGLLANATASADGVKPVHAWLLAVGAIQFAAGIYVYRNVVRSTRFEHAEDEPLYS